MPCETDLQQDLYYINTLNYNSEHWIESWLVTKDFRSKFNNVNEYFSPQQSKHMDTNNINDTVTPQSADEDIDL